jgi:transcriptional/translational regulatory protein YebC/TACO1
MPLVKQTLSLAAGATSSAVLTGTTYEYVGPGVGVRVAAATDQAPAAEGSNVVMNFTMNNTELTKNGAVSQLTAGDAFGSNGNYVMNDTRTPANSVRNRPIITFTNNTGSTALVDYAVFIS